jgi:hypothetical protein
VSGDGALYVVVLEKATWVKTSCHMVKFTKIVEYIW